MDHYFLTKFGRRGGGVEESVLAHCTGSLIAFATLISQAAVALCRLLAKVPASLEDGHQFLY